MVITICHRHYSRYSTYRAPPPAFVPLLIGFGERGPRDLFVCRSRQVNTPFRQRFCSNQRNRVPPLIYPRLPSLRLASPCPVLQHGEPNLGYGLVSPEPAALHSSEHGFLLVVVLWRHGVPGPLPVLLASALPIAPSCGEQPPHCHHPYVHPHPHRRYRFRLRQPHCYRH